MDLPINLPQQIQFEEHSVRVQVDDLGQPWFNANDVCAALELANPRDAVAKHADPEDVQKRDIIDRLGRRQLACYVNESGLYSLIFGSTKDAAKRFKRWVTHEVLPSIRKTGSYSTIGTRVNTYSVTHDCVSAILLIGKAMAKVPGVKRDIVAAATLSCIQENTGITTEILRGIQEIAKHENGSPTLEAIGNSQKIKKEVVQ